MSDDAFQLAVGALGLAVTASGVWLGVRLVNRREKWAKWTLVGLVVGLPVIYLLSFGPACWWLSEMPRDIPPHIITVRLAPRIYWPIGICERHAPKPLARAIRWYATLGLGNDAVRCGEEYPGDPIIFWSGFEE